jgi:FtsH-binding integral membrane protein
MADQSETSKLIVLEDEDAFVRETYLRLLASLAAMVVLGFFSYRYLPRSSFSVLCLLSGLIWIVCGWLEWRQPIGLVFGLFTLITGLFLGQVAHMSPRAFALSSMLALVTFSGLSLYVHLTRQSFYFLRGFLWFSFFILVGGCLLLPFAWNNIADLLLAAFGTLVFGCWILYDTSQLLERRDEDLTPAVGAFELILDIIGLRGWLQNLLRLRD